ncbi:MAG: late competence development ComFB family protein [Cyanobacteria bacterium P01_C01_bin.89]
MTRSSYSRTEDPTGLASHELRDRANVMEILVAEEVERQLRRCPNTLLDYVKTVEVETYALNRLPPLYAASQEGLEYQKERARREYGQKIQTTVRHALAAIQQDPLRRSTPLISKEDKVHHQLIIELAARFPTADDLKQTGLDITDGENSRVQAAHFRRSHRARSLSHQRSKSSTTSETCAGGWDWNHRYTL